MRERGPITRIKALLNWGGTLWLWWHPARQFGMVPVTEVIARHVAKLNHPGLATVTISWFVAVARILFLFLSYGLRNQRLPVACGLP